MYENIERLVGVEDDFDFSNYAFPPGDFYHKVSQGGRIKAGFAKAPVVRDSWTPANEANYCAAYFESNDGTDRYLVLLASTQHVFTDTMATWKKEIENRLGIPQDNIYWAHDHRHDWTSTGTPQNPTLFWELLDSAIANKEPVNVAFANYALPTGLVHNRAAYGDTSGSTQAVLMGLDREPSVGFGGIEWEIQNRDTAGVWILNGSDGRTIQRKFDNPLDSYLQFIVFKNDAGEEKGIFIKLTGHHTATTSHYMDSIAYWLGGTIRPNDHGNPKVYGGPVVFRFVGFAGNHVETFRGMDADGVVRTGNWDGTNDVTVRWFAKLVRPVILDSFPSLQYNPLTNIGVTTAYDPYGREMGNPGHTKYLGLTSDTGRWGACIQVLRFNDIYLTACPNEAVAEQGMFIRGRAMDKKVMYNAYTNTFYFYWGWGRMYSYWSCYHCSGVVPKMGCFNMAQDVVRGINILETSETPPLSIIPEDNGIGIAYGESGPFALGDYPGSVKKTKAAIEQVIAIEVSPNPFNPSIKITIKGNLKKKKIRISIFGVNGRLVREFELSNTHSFSSSSTAITWDGKDASFKNVVSGVYLVRLTAGAFIDNERIFLIR
jgi:hypothetical protein